MSEDSQNLEPKTPNPESCSPDLNHNRRRFILSISLGIIILIIAVIIVQSSFSSGVHSLKIIDIMKSPSLYINKEFKVSGKVVRGSITKAQNDFSVKFIISEEGKSLNCLYSGILPDPFAEDRDVVLLGKMKNNEEMLVQKITVKCPSKYQEEGRNLEEDDEYYINKYKERHEK